MKRKIEFLLTTALMFSLIACKAANESDHTNNSSVQTESSQVAESSVQDSQGNGENNTESADNTKSAESGKILIAYFAVAENSDVDVISSASVTEVNGEAKGLVRTIAEDIQAVTGGNLFSIETSVDYPGDIDGLIEYVAGEQDEDVHPELTSHIENLDEYETIFVGYPLWWDEAPAMIGTFLSVNDFEGKIIPFCTSSSDDIDNSPHIFSELCPNAEIAEGLTANDLNDIEPWIQSLGLME